MAASLRRWMPRKKMSTGRCHRVGSASNEKIAFPFSPLGDRCGNPRGARNQRLLDDLTHLIFAATGARSGSAATYRPIFVKAVRTDSQTFRKTLRQERSLDPKTEDFRWSAATFSWEGKTEVLPRMMDDDDVRCPMLAEVIEIALIASDPLVHISEFGTAFAWRRLAQRFRAAPHVRNNRCTCRSDLAIQPP